MSEGHRNTVKLTLRLRPSVVEDLKKLAAEFGCTISDVVSAGVEWLQAEPELAKQTTVAMSQIRLLVAWTRPVRKKKKRA